jgi:hypothetical protein
MRPAALTAGPPRLEDGENDMTLYTVRTDDFLLDNFEAESLDDAIDQAFDYADSEESLRRKFAKYVADGGWCWIEADGGRVLEIGDAP